MSTQETTHERHAFIRFPKAQRIEHAVLIASFTTLGITGLVQKFSGSPISVGLIGVMGGIEAVRIIHRIAATLFLLETIYHLVVMGYKLYVQRLGMTMLPNMKDARDIGQSIAYNLGMTKKRPAMGRYSYDEKMEYWALLWGLVVMTITGFMLWNPIATANILPGVIIPAAKAAHGGEAILAVLAIILWHFYNVHIRHFNKAMFTGQISRHEMEEFHAAELREIEAGTHLPAPDPKGESRRRRLYLPIAAVLSVALLGVLYYFVTLEESAITTLPPAERAPAVQTQPSAGIGPTLVATPTLAFNINAGVGGPAPAPTSTPQAPAGQPLTWNTGISEMFQANCASCHGDDGGLSVVTLADLLKGGQNGAAIVPGSLPSSLVITKLEKEDHPAEFTAEQLQQISQWIEAGAPE